MAISLPDITVKTQIYESANSLVYRGIRRSDNTAIILKVLKQDYPTTAELIRYKQEYEITRSLNLEGVIKAYSQQDYQRTLVIILEDFGGNSLQKLREARAISCPMSLVEFLRLAITITEILGRIHAANVIHKDINPSNIVFNPQTGIVKIIDFGIATQFSRTNPTFKSPHVLEGTLAYLSPEQTGRMNRLLDYRTDFYSLGVAFYELLTGHLPFPTIDILELVHCHIAKQPVLPHELNATIPKPVSDIILKLMAKNAEDRYQSAWGIKADLELCADQLKKIARIDRIQLGLQDVCDRFQIPQKLYGRDKEVALLLAAFDRAALADDRIVGFQNHSEPRAKVEMVLVSGYSGIGKSALVQELYKPITEKHGYFISGKFDQFQRNIPYGAVIEALRKLVQQLLSEPEEQVQQWRSRLLMALGNNGQLIVDVIPEVESLIGKQPTLAKVGSTEAQHRFNLVFPKFIRACCSDKHPLVIFLDDLQWVDLATLKLIELIVCDHEMQYLLLIGAYRDHEVAQTHPLMTTLEKLKQENIAINQITLAPLELESVTHLIAKTLHSSPEAIAPLAALVRCKTNGNPYFTNEFLKTLYTEDLINFNLSQRCWQWNIAEINAKNITDNVVALMIGKLRQLPESTQQILRLAACVGAEFDLATLCVICKRSAAEVFAELTRAMQTELILSTSELDQNLLIQHFKFLHDRVQQAAYTLMAEEQQQAVHLQIGYLFLQRPESETSSNHLFEVVDHLNLGRQILIEQPERDQLARLNLSAGQKAKTTSAHSAALQYLTIGIEMLAVDSWQTQYALTLALYEEATESASLYDDFQQMERWVSVVLNHAITILDKIKVYMTRIQSYVARGRQTEAIKVGLEVLKSLGIVLPESPTDMDIQSKLTETATHLQAKNQEDLLDLPLMQAPDRLAAMQILASLISATFQTAPKLLVLIICEQVNLSVQYGNDSFSSFAYSTYGGPILHGVIQDFEKAYQFGNLALHLAARWDNKKLRSKVLQMVAAHTIHCQDHVRETLPLLQESYEMGLETGDVEYGTYSMGFKCAYAHFAGVNLAKVELETRTCSHVLAQLKQENMLSYLHRLQQVLFNLMEPVENPTRLVGSYYNEEQFLPIHLAANDRTHLHYLYLYKLMLSHLFEDFSQALECAVQAELYADGGLGTFSIPVLNFYDSLVRLELYRSVPTLEQKEQEEQEQLLIKIIRNQEKMQKWADHAPANFQHKYDLIAAEKARVLGQIAEAMSLYEQAIAGAKDNQFMQEEALAYELAAKFYLGLRMERIAQTYLKEAHYCYEHWGAKAKVADLEAKYPHLLTQVNRTADIQTKYASVTTSSSNSKEALDLAAVMKASQAISGEIVLDKLLVSLMKILIENAGAQTGFLILEEVGEWKIEAACEIDSAVDEDGCSIKVSPSVLVENRLSAAIVNYVIRTKESVILNDATREGKFTLDPYIREHKPKSILCAPLLDRGQLSGIMYLENNLTTGAFSDDRIKILQLLSAQAASAITNAKLYTQVKERESRLTQFIDAMPVAVSVLDSNGRICYANQMTYNLCGISQMPETITEEFLEQIQIYQAGTDRLYLREQLPIVRSLAGETVTVEDMEFRHSERIIPISVSSTPVFDETGKIIYAIAAFQDISERQAALRERKQAEKLLADYNQTLQQQVIERTILLSQEIEERKRVENALRQSEEQRRLTMDLTNIGSWDWNIVEDTMEWNDNHVRLLGLVANEVESSYQAWRDRVHPEDIERVEQAVTESLATHTDYEAEYRVIHPDNSIHWLVGRGRGIYNQAGQPVRMLGVLFDISERRNAALRERKRAEEALVIEERNRMAREIHDTLAQAFTGIIIHSRSASGKLTTDAEKAQTHLTQAQELARSGLTEARRSVEALRRPYLLENGHLYYALARLATEMRLLADTRIVCEANGTAYPLPTEVENNLLRIGQEALTNAIKYATASEIRIELIYESNHCLLRVKDDGKGFEVGSIPSSGGFGLLGMSERAKHIGAQLTLQSQPGQGTEIVVAIDRG
ncbi:serine/threonine protein kinase and signal transduction histidine kinase with GAF and PAS/PAC sensor (plasmid) [Fischerella sp. NIES-4106]|nr:serine/threonine protein kinase and signal transduction histidine kinase with GAF and PAS/PAC sensor [Fischerella sp. NIES-4106]